jgi:hypothetical protein
MSDDGHPAISLRSLTFLLATLFVVAIPLCAQSAAQSGTIVETRSDKKVVQTGRWMVVRQFTINFEVNCSGKTYCGELTTTITNEADDLMASKGKPVQLLASGKDIDVTLENGRKIRAHQVDVTKCAQN